MRKIAKQHLKDVTQRAGVHSAASAALLSLPEFAENMDSSAAESDVHDAWLEARKQRNDLLILEKNVLTRGSPVLPKAIRLGLRHPEVSLLDYEEWFQRQVKYANPGDISSVFSPAAYLAEMYQAARKLYPEKSRWNIDTRRPDLAELVLSQKHMDEEVTALQLSNEILLPHVRKQLVEQSLLDEKNAHSDDAVMQALAKDMRSENTPWHYHYARLRQSILQKDPELKSLLAAAEVTQHMGGGARAALHFNIAPAMHQLLTEELTQSNAQLLYKKHFFATAPEQFLNPKFIRDWYGLTDEEVQKFHLMADLNNYQNGTMTTVIDNMFYRVTLTRHTNNDSLKVYPLSKVSLKIEGSTGFKASSKGYALCPGYTATNPVIRWKRDKKTYSDNQPFSITLNMKDAEGAHAGSSFKLNGPDSLRIGKWWPGTSSIDGEFNVVEWNIIPLGSIELYALKLNKAIRLYKATGLSPRELEDISESVSADLTISGETLALLSQIAVLNQRYAIPRENALIIAGGNISLKPGDSGISHWDRLFNSAEQDGSVFGPSDKIISLLPDKAGEDADIKVILKRALQTDDYGLYCLKQILKKNDPQASLQLSQKMVSGMYALSLWAKYHGLKPAELQQVLELLKLPADFASAKKNVWQGMLESLYRTTCWLQQYRWDLTELFLLTRPENQIAAGNDIVTFLRQLQDFILGVGQVVAKDQIMRLAPFISGAFALSSDTVAEMLLIWADETQPGGWSINTAWAELSKTGGTEDSRATAFACGLSQMVLFYKKTGLPVTTLGLFVKNPVLLGPEAASGSKPVLQRSLYSIRMAQHFGQWLRTLPAPDEATSLLVTAFSGKGLTAVQLASLTGTSVMLITQAMRHAHEHKLLLSAERVGSYAEIRMVMQWVEVSEAFSVTPEMFGQLLTTNFTHYRGGTDPASDWQAWQQLADAFAAGLTPAEARVAEGIVQEECSAALCGFLLNSDSDFIHFVTDREGLYQYLLADNLSGAQMKTSRIADAISALQTFIHRTLTAPEAPKVLDREAPADQFFLEWQRWNSRYSHWQAYRKLMYFPENYIDATTRLGQTRMMDEMLQALGQAQINEDTVGDAFMGYLTSFEEVANLTTFCAYHDNPDPKSGKTYFIGHSQAGTREYWWRTADEDKRDSSTNFLPANAWSAWEKINCIPQVWNNCLRPVVYKSRLYLIWIEMKATKDIGSDGKLHDVWSWQLKVSGLRYDGNWQEPVARDITAAMWASGINLRYDHYHNIGFYAATWRNTESIIISLYEMEPTGDKRNNIAWVVGSDMAIKPRTIDSELVLLHKNKQLVSKGYHPVINEFIGAKVVPERDWVSKGNLPEHFNKFELELQSIDTLTSEDDETYELNIQVRAHVELNAQNLSRDASYFMKVFPELKYLNETVYFSSWHGINSEKVMVAITDKNKVFFLYNMGIYRNEIYYRWYYKNEYEDVFLPLERVNMDFGSGLFSGVGYVTDVNAAYIRDSIPSNYKYFYYQTSNGMTRESSTNDKNYYVRDITLKDFVINPVPKENLILQLDEVEGKYVTASDDWDCTKPWTGIFNLTVPNLAVSSWKTDYHHHKIKFKINKFTNEPAREYTVKVMRQGATVFPVSLHVSETQGAQYMKYGDEKAHLTRLNTLFASELTRKAATGIATILNWATQNETPEPDMNGSGKAKMDFTGANGIYFWELFYYTPMLVMQRFLQEEQYDLAEHWLQYVFNPGGYIENLNRSERIWNVRPLHEDTSWNDRPLESYDPDAVAQNDPMHYKLHAFMRLLDIIISRGDAAYRKLDRDALAEAKVWYSRALNLLGDRPWIEQNSGWRNPQLKEITNKARQLAHMDNLSALQAGEPRPHALQVAGEVAGSHFNMEVNAAMLTYWDTLRLRMFNLRHNLSIDGQPLNLPLYALAADPKALLAAAVAAEAGAGATLPQINITPALRFTPLLESARNMASQLIQFGSSMQQILQSHDAAAMAQLLNEQGADLANSSLILQRQTLDQLAAERITLDKNREMIIGRRDHYAALYEENINAGEQSAMDLIAASNALSTGIKPLYVAAAIAGMAPNIFGFAAGGMKYEGPLRAAGDAIEIYSSALQMTANRIGQEEQYRRRRQEWEIQYKTADKELGMLEAQYAALETRVTAANMLLTQMEMQSAQASAQLELLLGQFSVKGTYSWLRARLATIFYQYYDLTASCCLMAQRALQWEMGNTTTYLRTGTWSGAWAGLMCGEGLMLSLAQMEMAWMKYQKRELEVTRTVSLKTFFSKLQGDNAFSLPEVINALLNKKPVNAGSGKNKAELNQNQLAVHFNLKDLGLTQDFSGKTCRIRSLAVTLPALLGPYQNIRGRLFTNNGVATLPIGCNEIALSHALQDNGLFRDNLSDGSSGARWLPFEGLSVDDDSGMTLSFQGAMDDQKALLESLSDVIIHVQFTAS